MNKHFNLILLALIFAGCKNTNHSNNKNNHNKLSSTEFIDKTYVSINGIICDEERKEITDQGGSPVYGEILPTSLKTLLDDADIKNEDVFYDLGSGTGKVTIQAYLDYPFKKAVGIELSQTRYNHSVFARNELVSQNGIDHSRTLEFRNEDITKSDISDATVIFMCATCFSDDLMSTITKKLSALKAGLKLFTLKTLQDPEAHNFSLIKTYSLPMTWNTGSPVYLYELKQGK